MPTEEEIREICARMTLAQDSEQFKAALTELKIAIRAHVTESENLGIQFLSNKLKAASGGSQE